MTSQDKARILIVDDVPDKIVALKAVLEDLDQEIVTAASGAEALRHLLNDDFAVILLDVNMPEMDGFETAALIRQRKRSEHTPIIFLTAFPDDTHAVRGYALGAVDYMLAPIVPEILHAKVSVFVHLYHIAADVKRQADVRIALAHEQAARMAAERANQAKNDFLANVSHELRTPMNVIVGMTDLALTEQLSSSLREYLTMARSSAYVLLELLNEILDLSKLEAGKFTLHTSSFSLRSMVSEVARAFEYRAADRGLSFQLQLAPNLPDVVFGDALRIRQVLTNFLSNAIKFTERGCVTLEAGVDCATSRDAWIRFSISDTGVGIAPPDLDRIFSPFTQVDASTTRRHGGTGLGLAIAADLIRAMGGRRHVTSQLGHGSTFSFSIPLPLEQQATQPDGRSLSGKPDLSALPPPTAATPMNILVVEDVPANQMLVQKALLRRGHAVLLASNGREAVEKASRHPLDLILMDLQMPEMDGFQATAAIRSMPETRQVPIIAITAHAMEADRNRCLAAGMNEYIAKPIDLTEMIELVEAWGQSSFALGHRSTT